VTFQPTGSNDKLWIIDQTPREPVEEVVYTDLDHSNIFISETAALAMSLRRIALQDGASIAGLLITTEARVAEKPKKETPMPPGGGMDY
jgi:hypothetical protein